MTPRESLRKLSFGTALEIMNQLRADGFVIVPIKPTDEMLDELARIGDGPMISGEECWGYMLAAALASNAT